MSTALADVVHTLTRPHLRRTTNQDGEDIYGQEPALLDILEDLVHPSASKGNDGGGGAGGSRPPISIDALDLVEEIKRTTSEHWPVYGLMKAPLRARVNAWYANTHEPAQALRLYEVAVGWVERIREALEPTKRMPLQGECPRCRNTHVETEDDGERKYNTAIIAYPGALPVYAECQVCLTRWEHEDLHTLRDQLV